MSKWRLNLNLGINHAKNFVVNSLIKLKVLVCSELCTQYTPSLSELEVLIVKPHDSSVEVNQWTPANSPLFLNQTEENQNTKVGPVYRVSS